VATRGDFYMATDTQLGVVVRIQLIPLRSCNSVQWIGRWIGKTARASRLFEGMTMSGFMTGNYSALGWSTARREPAP
jgi:hypothetical protein